jgi:hypothetical protein
MNGGLFSKLKFETSGTIDAGGYEKAAGGTPPAADYVAI